ncbi:uncharacterized protein LOC133846448 isoform X3 [Drosophila sulfurigaster albostrigata]|uniref:uncharacterized protein LOC133846448 isoform X3 n=1 Tax=Drosophila sulfurigaster albostrigata TaxID=89887 RepID=UPI002D219565|nr:uncharacterized protein LOC133846448 isoform X3 [Drosophila sulfurigaster albostrigata]
MTSEEGTSGRPMERFRFTDERHLMLVEAFSREPYLWSRGSSRYVWGARSAACKRIQNIMNGTLQRNETPVSLEGVKMKIGNLRTVYRRELRKIKENPSYYPNSCWFEPLNKILAPLLDKNPDDDEVMVSANPFQEEKADEHQQLISPIPLKRLQRADDNVQLIYQPSQKQTKAEVSETFMEENGDGNEELISPKSQKRLQVKVPRLKCIRVMPSEVEESTEIKIEHDAEADQLEPSTSTSPQLSVITSPPRSPSSNLPKIVNASSLQTALRNRDEDEFTFFGMSVAAQLRKMPLSSAMIMQSKIQHMISMERRKINGDTSEVNLFFQTELQGIF